MSSYRGLVLPLLAVTLSLCAQERSVAPSLKPYTSCQINSGPDMVDITPLPSANMTRSVKTIKGERQISMKDGVRVMFAYPDTDFFANIKAEELPAASFDQEKADLIGEFEWMLASGDNSRNYALKPTMQGLEISGLDRGKLEGGVLGVYLLFDNSTHVVTTIYFLNQDPARRKFSTLAEYAALRDQFLSHYVSCIRSNQSAKP
jgi:hypothetical protein